jgi:hypothetical protein
MSLVGLQALLRPESPLEGPPTRQVNSIEMITAIRIAALAMKRGKPVDFTGWAKSNPASITIYRLDPKQQYLIYGSPLAEVIQGSIYNNLIIPGGGADIITAGPGKNEIQGTKTELAAIIVTDFHAGDFFNFTDLDPNTATVGFNEGVLAVLENRIEVAAIALPGLAAGTNFTVSSNGNQPPERVGTLIWIDPAS